MNLLAGAGGFAAGAIIGSYLATLCMRWPRGQSASAGQSRCDHCGHTLSARDLVPLLSAISSGGKCRHCGGAIDPFHWRVELAAAFLAAFALAMQPNPAGAALALFWLILLPLILLDARYFWLPDKLTLVLAAAGLLSGGLATGEALADRLIGGIAGFALLWVLATVYRRLRGREGLGAGDPKLLGAIGLWTGWMALPVILLVAATGGLAAAIVTRRGRSEQMPLGTMLGLAAIAVTGMAALRSAGA